MSRAPITPVLLSGGSGTRLWPVSTEDRPKQFLSLLGGTSLLQQTLERVDDRSRFGPPMIVGAERHRDLLLDQVARADIDDALIVLEPVARNTAAAIGLAAGLAPTSDTLMLVMPSDHAIADLRAFHQAVDLAVPAAEDGALVTFGIEPTGPETGFGYIAASGDGDVRRVTAFVEKPDRTRAEELLAAGGHYWNAGIFLFRADAITSALETYAPEVARAVADALHGERSGDVVTPDRSALVGCSSVSIDVAVMERSDAVRCVPVSMGWSDVGSWDSLGDLLNKRDEADPRVRLTDSPNSRGHSDGPRITISGVPDVIVVATPDEVLVVLRGQSQRVKQAARSSESSG